MLIEELEAFTVHTNMTVNGKEYHNPQAVFLAHLPQPRDADKDLPQDNGLKFVYWKNAPGHFAVAGHDLRGWTGANGFPVHPQPDFWSEPTYWGRPEEYFAAKENKP